MPQYEYKFVEVPRLRGIKVQNGDTFEACKQVIETEAENGWRLRQIVTPFAEKAGMSVALGYQIILERERTAP